ncbi:5-oxoprolinase subunit B family protein [Hamadaea tsunoensis]|uniref:5-oxoprolinase subunit B family protein n=1 Tax=Hamadaea tsunoensis TaxID=53368 RepID=UPI000488A706|nr:carboxyltransferase domain-containing protein [Hamadaea tsunoensis]
MEIRRVGEGGLLLEVAQPYRWFVALCAARDRGEFDCVEIVPAASTVLLDGIADLGRTLRVLRDLEPADIETQATAVEIPVRWDGDDTAATAALWGRDPAAVLRETVFTVAFCGFAPGFAYLAGLPVELRLPRRATPRARVPAGSVATAGEWVGIYPRATPGGWHLLGSTSFPLFNLEKTPPLTPGTVVRFVDE